MPTPQFFRNVALSALLLGVSFVVANLYLGAHGHRNLATMFFGFAVLGDTIFAVSAVLWVYMSVWAREPERGPPPNPGAPAGPKPPAPAPQ